MKTIYLIEAKDGSGCQINEKETSKLVDWFHDIERARTKIGIQADPEKWTVRKLKSKDNVLRWIDDATTNKGVTQIAFDVTPNDGKWPIGLVRDVIECLIDPLSP